MRNSKLKNSEAFQKSKTDFPKIKPHNRRFVAFTVRAFNFELRIWIKVRMLPKQSKLSENGAFVAVRNFCPILSRICLFFEQNLQFWLISRQKFLMATKLHFSKSLDYSGVFCTLIWIRNSKLKNLEALQKSKNFFYWNHWNKAKFGNGENVQAL